jgi:hypothetical protein
MEFVSSCFASLFISELGYDVASTALDAFAPLIPALDDAQISGMISLTIHAIGREMAETDLLPSAATALIDAIFESRKHEPVYTFLKEKIQELIEGDFIAVALLLYAPILASAPEQITNDAQEFISILESGLNPDNRLAAQAACSLVDLIAETDDLHFAIPELFAFLYPLMSVDDNDLRHHALCAVQAALGLEQSYPDLFVPTWELKAHMRESDEESYLQVLAHVIKCSPEIPDDAVQATAEFVAPLIERDDPPLAAAALLVLSSLIKHNEQLIFGFLEQTVPPVCACLSSSSAEAIVSAATFAKEIVTHYQEEALPFINEIWGPVEALLIHMQKRKHKARFREAVRGFVLSVGAAIVRLSGDSDRLAVLLSALNREFQRPNLSADAIGSTKKIIALLSPEDAGVVFEAIFHLCTSTDKVSILSRCFRTLKGFLKPPVDGGPFLPASAEICRLFFAGELPVLKRKSILDPSVDIDWDIIDAFGGFLSRIVLHPSPIVDELCMTSLAILGRSEDRYRDFVVGLFISAIEASTISGEIINQLMAIVPSFLDCESLPLRHNLTYLLLLLAKRAPGFVSSLPDFLPAIGRWWESALQNPSGSAELIANIASFFLFLTAVHSFEFEEELMLQIIGFFPPADCTEAAFMAENLVKLVGRGVSHDLSLRIAVAVGRLLTENQKSLRKMNVPDAVLSDLAAFFRQVCRSDEAVGQAIVAEFAGSSAKIAQLVSIINQ